jgi:hypothetical protein
LFASPCFEIGFEHAEDLVAYKGSSAQERDADLNCTCEHQTNGEANI